MITVKKCCCCLSLKNGVLAAGVATVLVGGLLVAFCAYGVSIAEHMSLHHVFTHGNTTRSMRHESREQRDKVTVGTFEFITALAVIVSSLWLLSGALLLVAAIVEITRLVLPWMAFTSLLLVIIGTSLAFCVTHLHEVSRHSWIALQILTELALLFAGLYALIVVASFYRYRRSLEKIQRKRGNTFHNKVFQDTTEDTDLSDI